MRRLIVISLFLFTIIGCKDKNSPIEPKINEGKLITAQYNVALVTEMAIKADPGIKLTSISSSNVDANGFSSSWDFCFKERYVNSREELKASFMATSSLILCNSKGKQPITLGDAYLLTSWLDSDKALKIAEANGGSKFRQDNSNYIIKADLGEGVIGTRISIWSIRYISNTTGKSLTININASTGDVLSVN